MEKKRPDKDTKNNSLSQSYLESIEKVIRTDTSIKSLSMPGTVLNEREQYWGSLIVKYSNLSDGSICNVDSLAETETSDPESLLMSKLPVHKSSSFIQFWVNTGNYPCETLEEESEYYESCSSLSERELSSLPDTAIVKCLNRSAAPQARNGDSSSTSVDTTAYILSNTNVTRKAKKTTILEDAKCSTLVDAWNNSAHTMDHTENKRLGVDNRDLLFAKNANRNNYFCTSHSLANGAGIALNRSDGIPEHTTLHKKNDTNGFRNVCQTAQNDNGTMTNKDAAALVEQHNIEEEKDTWCTSMKLNRRKKLYSGRDSPVDLAHIQSRYEDNLSQTRKSLHPALCSTIPAKQRPLKKRKLVLKRRNRIHFCEASCLDDGELRVALGTDCTEIDDATPRKNSDTRRECEDMDTNIKTKCSIENNSVENKTLSSSNGRQHNNILLSSNEVTVKDKTGETTSVTKESSINFTKPRLLDVIPVIRLTRLSACDIERYKKHTNFNPNVVLTRLSGLYTQNYKTNERKTALLPHVIRDDGAQSCSNVSTISTSDTKFEPVGSDDRSSTQSTLLLCPCNDNKEEQDDSSVFTVCINNNFQDVLYNSKGHSKERSNTSTGTKVKSNDTDEKSFVTTLSNPLRRTRRKLDKNIEMEERGELRELRKASIITRNLFESSSEYSCELAASSIESEESRATPKKATNNDKNSNIENNSSVDRRSKCLSNKLTISPRLSDTSSKRPGSQVSDESELIGNHSLRTRVEKRKIYSLVVTSSDEDETFIQRLKAQDRSKRGSKTKSTNDRTDEENSMRRTSVTTRSQNIFAKSLQNKREQSVNIRDRNCLNTQEELRENGKNNSACESAGDNSKNKTIRRHRKYYRIASSSDESKVTDSSVSEIEKSCKSSNKRTNSLHLRRPESAIRNYPNATVEIGKKDRSLRTIVTRKVFKARVFDVNSDSQSYSSD